MAETTGSVLERLSSVPEKPRSTLSRLSGATEDDSSTLGTIASEAGKAAFGLGASAVQGVETLANELLPEGIAKTLTLDNSVGNFLESIQQGFGPQKEGAAATIGQAIGGVAPSFALGATVGLPAMIGVFALSMFNDAFEEAEAAGVSDAKKWAFAASVAGLAPLEAVPVGRTLSILNRGTGGLLQKFVKKGGSASIKKLFEVAGRHKSGRALLAVLQAAPEEAIQESLLNQIPENLLAKAFGVDPDRQAFAGAGRAALLGAIGGGVGAAAISPFTGGPQDAARTKDQIEEAGRPTAVQGQPTQTQPKVEAQAGVAQRESEGATEAVKIRTSENIQNEMDDLEDQIVNKIGEGKFIKVLTKQEQPPVGLENQFQKLDQLTNERNAIDVGELSNRINVIANDSGVKNSEVRSALKFIGISAENDVAMSISFERIRKLGTSIKRNVEKLYTDLSGGKSIEFQFGGLDSKTGDVSGFTIKPLSRDEKIDLEALAKTNKVFNSVAREFGEGQLDLREGVKDLKTTPETAIEQPTDFATGTSRDVASQKQIDSALSDTGGRSEVPPVPPNPPIAEDSGTSPEGTITTTPRFNPELKQEFDRLGIAFEEDTPQSREQLARLAQDGGFVENAVRNADFINAKAASDSPVVPNSITKAGMALRQESLQISERDLMRRKRQSKSAAEVNRIQAELDRVTQDQESIIRAFRSGGSEAGRALESQKLLVDESFSLGSVLQSATAEKGSPLTSEQRARFAKMIERLAALEDQVTRLKAQIAKLNPNTKAGRKAIKRLNEAIVEAQLDVDMQKQNTRNATKQVRPLTLMDRIGEIFNISRTLLVSLDASAVLRQGGKIGLANPEITIRNFGPMLRAMMSERTAFRINQSIINDPLIQEYMKNGLHISELFGTGLSKQEEAYMRRTGLDKVPIVRTGVRASERAFVTFLNLMRAQAVKKFDSSLRNGRSTQSEKAGISNMVNILTGRGDLGRFNKNAAFMSTILFAPRYVVSQFQTLTLNPIRRAGSNRVRLLIAGQYVRMLGSFGLLVSLAAMAGFDIEYDRRSSDFLKLRKGRTRVDIGTGLLQPIVLISRIQTGESKSPTSGKIARLRGPDRGRNRQTFGRSVPNTLARFFRSKLSPVNAMAIDLMAGENVIGDEVNVTTVKGAAKLAADQLTPISIQEIWELSKEEDNLTDAAAFSLLSLLGAGISTFDTKESKPQRR